MTIISWNINGIASRHEELKHLASEFCPDIICLQKVRYNGCRSRFALDGYNLHSDPEDIGNWSGVMTYSNKNMEVKRIITPELSIDGHLQMFDCSDFYLANAYVPFSNPRLPGAIEFRKKWDEHFHTIVVCLSSKKPMIICGDLNTVLSANDTCEKKVELNRPNFYTWERENLARLISDADLSDSYRQLHPEGKAATFYGNFRLTGLGNRIDYFLVSNSLLDDVEASEILTGFGTGQSVPLLLRMN